MSERETGVGREGHRLAVFSATAPSRLTAVRLVIEHAGTGDLASRNYSAFAKAATEAIQSLYQTPGEATTTTTTTLPPIVYPPKPIPAPDEMSAQGHKLVRNVPAVVTATVGQEKRTAPSKNAPSVPGTAIKRNRRYTFDFSTEAEIEGEKWLVSKNGSWAMAKGFKP